MEIDGIIGKKIKVIFEDGKDHVSSKEGTCTYNSETEIILNSKDIIPKSRVIRMEVRE